MPSLKSLTPALVIVGVVLLAGCAPAAPPRPSPTSSTVTSPTPTPTTSSAATPAAVDPPATADEAVAHAIETITRYMELRSAVYADPNGNHDLDVLIGGTAATRLRDEASQLAAQGIHAEGQFRFETGSGSASETIIDNVTIPFGAVTLDGCYDSTDVEAFNADGSSAPLAADRRVRFHPVVVYRPSTQTWIVYETPDPEVIEAC